MKAWLLILILLAPPLLAEEIDNAEKPLTVEEELYEIFDKMMDMENALREDRHDPRVQLTGTEIADQLDKLINEIEDAKATNKPPRGKVLAQRWTKLRSLASGNPPPQKVEPGSVKQSSDSKIRGENPWWYKLPPEHREAMVQTYAAEIPLKWKQRIAAYFISIAVEETKTYSPPPSSGQPHKAQ